MSSMTGRPSESRQAGKKYTIHKEKYSRVQAHFQPCHTLKFRLVPTYTGVTAAFIVDIVKLAAV